MYISNVSLDSINNNSTCSSTSYSNFTNQSTTISQGNAASFSVTSYVYNQYVNIWVDFNNNGVFDSVEYVVKNLYTNNSLNAIGNFTVPVTTPIGKHTMRIMADYYQITDITGCGGVYYGETEDYTINVDSAKTMKVDSIYTTQNKNLVSKSTAYNQIIGFNVKTKQGYYPIKVGDIYMSSNGTSDTNDIYNAKLWYTNSSNIFATTTQIGATVSSIGQHYSFNDSINLAIGDNYFWLTYDVAANAKFADFLDATLDSIIIDSKVYLADSASPYGTRMIDYCTPPASNAPCTYMYTSNVTIDSINNSSGCN
ncbi:MAG: hypothetical protein HYZ42_08710, partial [Bacteroidetes bacterium]|nr:hypothetical protein [Bacteroidota bacterium]